LVYGYYGDDTIFGGTGDDTIFGGSNGVYSLSFYESDGNDFINGGAGKDILNGESGNDFLNGDIGNDTLDGGSGNDILVGGAGNDRLIGGTGNDTLTGGTGSDRFSLTNSSIDGDVITDFKVSENDKIELVGNATQYILVTDNISGYGTSAPDTFIYRNDSSPTIPTNSIAIITDVSGLSLTSNVFVYV
jgi:Ca2+-binding RTX toxin-like protein